MNPFELNVTCIDGELPIGGVIPAGELDRYIGAGAVLERNRSRAAAILVAARRQRDRVRRQARHILDEAHAEAERRAAQAARDAHDETCATVVRWVIEEGELERAVAARLEGRCRAWVAETVRMLVGDSDRTATLLSRIDGQLRGLASHGAVTIRVSPPELDALAARLPANGPFDIVADPGLETGQALLDSPYVQLRIDLCRQLAGVLAAIGGTSAAEVSEIGLDDAAERHHDAHADADADADAVDGRGLPMAATDYTYEQ